MYTHIWDLKMLFEMYALVAPYKSLYGIYTLVSCTAATIKLRKLHFSDDTRKGPINSLFLFYHSYGSNGLSDNSHLQLFVHDSSLAQAS